MALRAFSFLRAKLRALWHEHQGHDVQTRRLLGRVDTIFCRDCDLVLWVRP